MIPSAFANDGSINSADETATTLATEDAMRLRLEIVVSSLSENAQTVVKLDSVNVSAETITRNESLFILKLVCLL